VALLFAALFLRQGVVAPRHGWLFLAASILLAAGALLFADFSAKLVSVLMLALLLLLFHATLTSEAPLIERFARLEFPEMPAELRDYCRKVTWLWIGFFALNMLLCLALALWAPTVLWAFYCSIGIWILVGATMAGEYLWRRHRFSHLGMPTLAQTLRTMARDGHRVWRERLL